MAIEAGVLALGSPRDFVHTGADLFAVSPALSDEHHQFYLRQIAGNTKTRFARWLISEGLFGCDRLRAVLRDLQPHLNLAARPQEVEAGA
jgi:hypothetical protein